MPLPGKHFTSTILMHPGLGNSGELHWQSKWCANFPEIIRIEQRDWETPARDEWVQTLDHCVLQQDPAQVILVGHSLACTTIAYWAKTYRRKIKGALLAGPSDTEATSYPPGTTGFTPMPLQKFEFPTIVITSANDFYVSLPRAEYLAKAWGSKLVNIGNAGHINVSSGFGDWEEGLEYLRELDELP